MFVHHIQIGILPSCKFITKIYWYIFIYICPQLGPYGSVMYEYKFYMHAVVLSINSFITNLTTAYLNAMFVYKYLKFRINALLCFII